MDGCVQHAGGPGVVGSESLRIHFMVDTIKGRDNLTSTHPRTQLYAGEDCPKFSELFYCPRSAVAGVVDEVCKGKLWHGDFYGDEVGSGSDSDQGVSDSDDEVESGSESGPESA